MLAKGTNLSSILPDDPLRRTLSPFAAALVDEFDTLKLLVDEVHDRHALARNVAARRLCADALRRLRRPCLDARRLVDKFRGTKSWMSLNYAAETNRNEWGRHWRQLQHRHGVGAGVQLLSACVQLLRQTHLIEEPTGNGDDPFVQPALPLRSYTKTTSFFKDVGADFANTPSTSFVARLTRRCELLFLRVVCNVVRGDIHALQTADVVRFVRDDADDDFDLAGRRRRHVNEESQLPPTSAHFVRASFLDESTWQRLDYCADAAILLRRAYLQHECQTERQRKRLSDATAIFAPQFCHDDTDQELSDKLSQFAASGSRLWTAEFALLVKHLHERVSQRVFRFVSQHGRFTQFLHALRDGVLLHRENVAEKVTQWLARAPLQRYSGSDNSDNTSTNYDQTQKTLDGVADTIWRRVVDDVMEESNSVRQRDSYDEPESLRQCLDFVHFELRAVCVDKKESDSFGEIGGPSHQQQQQGSKSISPLDLSLTPTDTEGVAVCAMLSLQRRALSPPLRRLLDARANAVLRVLSQFILSLRLATHTLTQRWLHLRRTNYLPAHQQSVVVATLRAATQRLLHFIHQDVASEALTAFVDAANTASDWIHVQVAFRKCIGRVAARSFVFRGRWRKALGRLVRLSLRVGSTDTGNCEYQRLQVVQCIEQLRLFLLRQLRDGSGAVDDRPHARMLAVLADDLRFGGTQQNESSGLSDSSPGLERGHSPYYQLQQHADL
ncbi:MAG: hypothetical protein MHM6MM_002601 [Cercozoa sp. M6MM]